MTIGEYRTHLKSLIDRLPTDGFKEADESLKQMIEFWNMSTVEVRPQVVVTVPGVVVGSYVRPVYQVETEEPPFYAFNINETVKVKLTDYGRQVHREQDESLREAYPNIKTPYTPPKEDAEGWSSWQMWQLMEMFGYYMGNGAENCFETVILIPRDKLKGAS